MTFSLRQLSRSRRLRAMGVLAWLMLVLQSLNAMPVPAAMSHAAQHGHAAHAVAMVMDAACDHAQPDAASAAHHCCDGHGACCSGLTGGACSCAAMTGTALPSSALSMLPSGLAENVYALLRDPGAPTVSHGPPLRPPAV